jgi:thiol:disulfide interchange protein
MRHWICFAIALASLSGCATGKPRPTLDEVQHRYLWVASYAPGMQIARATRKPAVLFFYRPWCWECRELILDAAADERVSELMRQFVLIGVNTTSEPGAAREYSVTKVPDVRYVSADGAEVGRLTDRDMRVVARQLEEILAPTAP